MTKIIKKTLPHTPASTSFVNPEIKILVSQLMENIKSLKKQIEDLQTAVVELQRR
jgi:hypothetical protein